MEVLGSHSPATALPQRGCCNTSNQHDGGNQSPEGKAGRAGEEPGLGGCGFLSPSPRGSLVGGSK